MKTAKVKEAWAKRHDHAIKTPMCPHEYAIGRMVKAWMMYEYAYRERFESEIGDDYVLGPAWAKIGHELRTLLNGELGRLDAGTLDGALVKLLEKHGEDV